MLTDVPIYEKGDLVQFVETHKWCPCIGIIDEIKDCNGDYRYMVGVPIPEKGTAYIFSMESKREFEYVGKSLFVYREEESDEED